MRSSSLDWEARCGINWIFCLAILLASPATPRAASGSAGARDPSSSPPGISLLSLEAQFEVQRADSNARDIRWASSDSVFVAFELDGVRELDLVEGLPAKRQVFPSFSQTKVPILNIALSGSDLHAWAESRRLGWVDTATSDTSTFRTKTIHGYFDDVDVRDDQAVVLGYPSSAELEKSKYTFLWIGDLRSELAQWAPLTGMRQAEDEAHSVPIVSVLSARLGSVRFLGNGDILVAPAIQPGIFRFTRAGKKKMHWTSEDLKASLLAQLGQEEEPSSKPPGELEPRPASWSSIKQYIESQPFMIEDVFAVGKVPAAIIRQGAQSDRQYFLALLGPETTWFRLPIQALSSSNRIRADYSEPEKKLVLLVAHRAGDAIEQPGRIYLIAMP